MFSSPVAPFLIPRRTIRAKVQSPSYTLPEMLHDLNAICEPFLNHSPEHAQYATNFLERANESIVNAVRDAQMVQPQADGGYTPDGQQYGQPGATDGMYGQVENGQMGNGYVQNGQAYGGHAQNGQMQYSMVQQTPPSQHYQDSQGYHGKSFWQGFQVLLHRWGFLMA